MAGWTRAAVQCLTAVSTDFPIKVKDQQVPPVYRRGSRHARPAAHAGRRACGWGWPIHSPDHQSPEGRSSDLCRALRRGMSRPNRRPAALVLCAAVLVAAAAPAHSLHAYGHAYSRPLDFTDSQIQQIAARFEIFTVEKGSATSTYGPRSSIAATIGTAKRIKGLNSSVRVLMYWNAAIHYDLYECERDVKSTWLVPGPGSHREPFYNYSVPEFRQWWVKCAVDAVLRSEQMLDGVFLDATPKVMDGQCYTQRSQAQVYWNSMVDQIRSQLPRHAVCMDNGFFLAGKFPRSVRLAGADAWQHSGTTYTESLSNIGRWSEPPDRAALEQAVSHLRWIANSSAANPKLRMVGHGAIGVNVTAAGSAASRMDPEFLYGLAKYMLVTSSMEDGWFLANDGYSISEGLLLQPMAAYSNGLGCGEPVGSFRKFTQQEFVLTRSFERGSVQVDLNTASAKILCDANASAL
eukprot:SAG31_NODE_962_length_10731_cov_4.198552_6_plen_463_part_00